MILFTDGAGPVCVRIPCQLRIRGQTDTRKKVFIIFACDSPVTQLAPGQADGHVCAKKPAKLPYPKSAARGQVGSPRAGFAKNATGVGPGCGSGRAFLFRFESNDSDDRKLIAMEHETHKLLK